MRTLSNILVVLVLAVLSWPLVGCGHTTFEVKKGGLDLHGRSYNEEVMALAASKAYTNVVNAETCAEAAKNGNACATADVMVTPRYGTGGFGGGGMDGNAMCSLYGVCGGPVAADGETNGMWPSAGNAASQGQTSSSTPVTREELDAVKAQAARAERMGKASIDQTKRVVKSLAGRNGVTQPQPAAASSSVPNVSTSAPTTSEPASANLPAP